METPHPSQSPPSAMPRRDFLILSRPAASVLSTVGITSGKPFLDVVSKTNEEREIR